MLQKSLITQSLITQSLIVLSAIGLSTIGLGVAIHPAAANSANPIRIANRDAVEALRDRAQSKYAKQDFKGAIADFTTAIKLNPKDASLYSGRSEAYRFTQEYKKGIADQDMAIKLDPSEPYYAYQRAILNSEVNDYKGAIGDMTTYIASLPPELKITGMHRFRGNMYQKAGDHQKAIADLTTEIKYWGADVDASLYQERAASYLAVGNKVAAKQDLQWVVDYYQKLGSEYEPMREAAVKELTAVK